MAVACTLCARYSHGGPCQALADLQTLLERGFDQSRNVSHRLNRLGMDFMVAIGLVALVLAAGVKLAFDPLGLLNPGKVL